jgi:hypothetical protein
LQLVAVAVVYRQDFQVQDLMVVLGAAAQQLARVVKALADLDLDSPESRE